MFKSPKIQKFNNAFLLFEVLIAIIVASVALIVLMQGLGSSLKAGSVIENYFKASCLAEAKISLLEREVSIKPDFESGRFSQEEDPDGKFSWEQKATQVYRAGVFGVTELPVCNVEVTVKWKGRGGEQQVKLVTYLLKYEESPAER